MDLQTDLSAVQSWPSKDRLPLIEELWEGFEAAPETTGLSDSQKQDLQRRLDAYRENPKACSPWEEVRERLQWSKR